jgi:hypothetical protein
VGGAGLLEARPLGRGRVYRYDMEVNALKARSFNTGEVYTGNVIEHVGVRGPVFRYRLSI